jgi:hypothetical protein
VLISCKPIVAGWNDTTRQIEAVMSTAKDYADAVIIGGLRLDSAIAAAIRASGHEVPLPIPDQWGGKELNPATREEFMCARSAICPTIPLYDHTSCAVSYVMHIKNYNSLRKRNRSSCSESCPVSQIARCDD